MPISDCSTTNDFDDGWDCVCTDRTALEGFNECITSSCSSDDQNCASHLHPYLMKARLTWSLAAIFADVAQACANGGSPITDVPAQATFSATSGGTLFGSWGGCTSSGCDRGRGGPGHHFGGDYGRRPGHCAKTTFTGNWNGWAVSWAGDDDDCATTTATLLATSAATSPSQVSATTTATTTATSGVTVPVSLGATVTTIMSGRTLVGTVFSAEAASATVGSAAAAQENEGTLGRNEGLRVQFAMVLALMAAVCMI